MLRALHIIINKQSVGWLYISLIIHLSLAYTPPPSFILTWQMNHNLILEQYWSFIIIINFIMSIIIYGTHLINTHLQTGYWLKVVSFIIIVDLMLAVMRASILIIIIIYRIQTIYLTSLLIFFIFYNRKLTHVGGHEFVFFIIDIIYTNEFHNIIDIEKFL